ncbi:MAG: DegV family protein [Clostridiales bacterium]|nr:DegV family protein [Clostridiales bacterium]
MSGFKIFTDSACDLPMQTLKEHDIGLISYFVNVGGDPHTYLRDMVDISANEFYKIMRETNISPKTSMPPISDYMDEFKTALDSGLDVLCITITQKFSGSFASATNAKNILAEEYHNNEIVVVDSKTVAGIQGGLVLEAVRMKEAGFTVKETAAKLEQIKETANAYVTVDSLKYLERGGRIGKASAFAGALLNIKPVLGMKDGEVFPLSKVRGRKKAISEIIERFRADIEEEKEKYAIQLLHGDAYDEIMAIKEELVALGFDCPKPLDVGVTIGSHIGPTAVAVGYVRKYEFS